MDSASCVPNQRVTNTRNPIRLSNVIGKSAVQWANFYRHGQTTSVPGGGLDPSVDWETRKRKIVGNALDCSVSNIQDNFFGT
jgi:hypothetical protein